MRIRAVNALTHFEFRPGLRGQHRPDYPNKTSPIVLEGRADLRLPYSHPADVIQLSPKSPGHKRSNGCNPYPVPDHPSLLASPYLPAWSAISNRQCMDLNFHLSRENIALFIYPAVRIGVNLQLPEVIPGLYHFLGIVIQDIGHRS